MIHAGDITKIDGAKLPIVDCIIGGSPCQDLSVAGKRAGLAGERSGLFMEQIRIVKEMRDESRRRGDKYIRPRYMVWENVPGAFTSGAKKGEDFAAVIEEIIKVNEPDARVCVCVCVPDKGWTKAGCYYSEDGRWSIAWRVHDAQFWGVPQRRKRIALVADFGGLSAPEILFERKGGAWRSEQGDEAGQEAPGKIGESVESSSREGEAIGLDCHNQATTGEVASAIRSKSQDTDHTPCVVNSSGNEITQPIDAHYGLGCGARGGNEREILVDSAPLTFKERAGKPGGQGTPDTREPSRNDILDAESKRADGRKEAVACDLYNHQVTGDVAATLNASSCATASLSGPSVLDVKK